MIKNKKLKIAMVVQRYGLEVNGGAELLTRQIAEKLVQKHSVEVLTTCAIDYTSWKNEYEAGTCIINDVKVRRFKNDFERNPRDFEAISQRVINTPHRFNEEIEWMNAQGPVSNDLTDFIKANENSYDVFIFTTYLYYTTYAGLQLVARKSILISTAHDEPPIYLDIFNPIFHLPRGMVYLTEEEKEFVHKKFMNDYIPYIIGCAGIEVPDINTLPDFKTKFNINSKYIVYVGRIDTSKGCDKLFEYFIKYKSEQREDLKLVLIGKPVMEIPNHKDIILAGFVSDEDKFAAMYGAELLCLPSQYESLSMVVLESLLLKRPVLVNGHCEVLKGHCIKSNAGLYFKSYLDFKECLKLMTCDKELSARFGENGFKYVSENYQWDAIIDRLEKLLLGAIG